MLATFNYACRVHHIVKKEPSYILMGEHELSVFENFRETQT